MPSPEDIPCGIGVGVLRMTAGHADERLLRLPIFRRDVAAGGAGLARVPGIPPDPASSPPPSSSAWGADNTPRPSPLCLPPNRRSAAPSRRRTPTTSLKRWGSGSSTRSSSQTGRSRWTAKRFAAPEPPPTRPFISFPPSSERSAPPSPDPRPRQDQRDPQDQAASRASRSLRPRRRGRRPPYPDRDGPLACGRQGDGLCPDRQGQSTHPQGRPSKPRLRGFSPLGRPERSIRPTADLKSEPSSLRTPSTAI